MKEYDGIVSRISSIVMFICFALLRCTRLLHWTPPPAFMPLLDLFHPLPLLLASYKPNSQQKASYVFIVVYINALCMYYEILNCHTLRSQTCSKLYNNASLHITEYLLKVFHAVHRFTPWKVIICGHWSALVSHWSLYCTVQYIYKKASDSWYRR
jgi:hypothetical protein